MPHLLRTGIADVLGIPESELRVVAPQSLQRAAGD
jgi:hypothetical protein